MSSGIVKDNQSLALKNNLNSQKLSSDPDFIIDPIFNKRLEFSDLNDVIKLINSYSINKNDYLLLLDKIRTILTEDKKLSLKDKSFCCLVERNVMKLYLKFINKMLNI